MKLAARSLVAVLLVAAAGSAPGIDAAAAGAAPSRAGVRAAAPPRPAATGARRPAAKPAHLRPSPPRAGKRVAAPRRARDPQKLGAYARVAFGAAGELRPAREVTALGRRGEPLTPEEEAAAQIQKLLRGPLRAGVTGLYVADARTGQPLFAVNADDPLNPASNVKLIATATALELLGPTFRYITRVLGATPVAGVVRGDVYLLGSHDPTLVGTDLDNLAAQVAARGVTAIEGDVVVGADPTRDGLFRAIIPISIAAGEPGKPPTAAAPAGHELVAIKVTATTGRGPRSRLTYRDELLTTDRGQPRIQLTIGGTIGKGAALTYPLWTRQRTAAAASGLAASLRAHGVALRGEIKVMELGDFVGTSVVRGALPIELARHESQPLADIVSVINKWSVNWLADRVLATAAGIAARKPPSLALGLEAMYGWLDRAARLDRKGILLDTGSGLSYQTQISPHALVEVVRSAAGFAGPGAPPLAAGHTSAPAGPVPERSAAASAWLRSLAVGGSDGTLRGRLHARPAAGRVLGKTGTLSTVIALSGLLELDPQRPLAFAIVTNTDAPIAKAYVRRAHDQVIAEVGRYLTRTAARPLPQVAPAPAPAPADPGALGDESVSEAYDPRLDADALRPAL
jgi:D-alanyl-D-alanine carboxypeptidase/D-alanyl-D-alanine-endopeptidase (penicillin-binding protein 4)